MTNLTLKLAESVRRIGVTSVYGDPVTLDGVTMVPVAIAQFGFGGGGDENDNGGGGGGGMAVPVGAYVRDENGFRFQPNPVALLAVGIPFVFVAGRALRLLIKAAKKRR